MIDLTDAIPQPFDLPAGTSTRGQRTSARVRWRLYFPNGRWVEVTQTVTDGPWTLALGTDTESDLTVGDVNDRLATIAAL